MRVTVKYFGIFRNVTGKDKEDLFMMEGQDIAFLLSKLTEKYHERFKRYIYPVGKKGISETSFIFVNGENISTLEDMRTKLKDNDCILVTPLMSGG